MKYDPKKRAIPCKDGGYRCLHLMTSEQLAAEGIDADGNPWPSQVLLPADREISDAIAAEQKAREVRRAVEAFSEFDRRFSKADT